jgi:DcmR-like sensory protein
MQLQFERVLAETCRQDPTRPGVAGHDVQFYRTEESLTRNVVELLAAGVAAGQPIVVFATEPHRRLFEQGLRERGLDTDELYSGRLAVWLDARDTLTAFMEGSLPSRELFMATVGSVFERILNKRSYLIIRGYGEMVDLLWQDGNAAGAIALEELWNDLADRYAYSLLCGYSVDNFLTEGGVDGFRRVCSHHTHVLPLDPAEKDVA